MTRILVIDSETGGLSPLTDALLSVGLVDYEFISGTVLRTKEIFIDPEGLACESRAMEVNGIDLDVHCSYSISREEAASAIQEFCLPMARPWILGHNVQFDIGFVRRLFTPEALRRCFSHRVLDTMQVLAYLGHVGLIPDGIGKLDQAISHFGIVVPEGKRHSALADAVATAELYTKLLQVTAGVRV